MLRLILSAAVLVTIAVVAVPEFQSLAARATAETPAGSEMSDRPVQRSASGGSRLGDVVVEADSAGHYNVIARSGGQRIDMLVDTGATAVALRVSDARRLGVFVGPADFTLAISTANGTVKGARGRLADLTVGDIRVANVDVLVLPDATLGRNLLGMSFLGRIGRFEVADRRLVLSE